MKKTILSLSLICVVMALVAQKKTTTSAIITFDATTSTDGLPKAENAASIAVIDIKKGTVAFETLIKNFSFSNPKMQEHFNSAGWMNSDKYPAAKFNGKITNPSNINFNKNGTYIVTVEGELTIRGITKSLRTPATITVSGKMLQASSSFTIKLDDYNITGSAIGLGKVSKEPKITVKADLK